VDVEHKQEYQVDDLEESFWFLFDVEVGDNLGDPWHSDNLEHTEQGHEVGESTWCYYFVEWKRGHDIDPKTETENIVFGNGKWSPDLISSRLVDKGCSKVDANIEKEDGVDEVVAPFVEQGFICLTD